MTETAADDQDLAKALDNVAGAAADLSASAANASGGLTFEETAPTASVTPLSTPSALSDPSPLTAPVPPLSSGSAVDEPASAPEAPLFPTPSPSPLATPSVSSPANSGPLADIKKDALLELRPLVDKLNVSPEEKFDTYLLLIRSTDDTNLIAPAHEAAKAISDETRRAEALLDIVKEIDYLSQQKAA